jgi:hypothetical protein
LNRFDLPAVEDLHNESDVEQKLVYPLPTTPEPFGLGISPTEVLTKHNIRRLTIGKGKERKSYFPDYLIQIAGIPLVVVEVKDPNEDLAEGFREARLYASEINAIFHPGLNPLTKVIATNGKLLLAGSWDAAEPLLSLKHADLNLSSDLNAQLHSMLNRTTLQKDFVSLSGKVKPKSAWKPRRMIGGISIQEEEVGHNTFGLRSHRNSPTFLIPVLSKIVSA